MCATPRSETSRGDDLPTSWVADRDAARVERPEAGDGLDELRLAVALHAGDGHDLACSNLEVEALDGHLQAVVADVQVVDPEHDLAGLCGSLRDDELDVAPDHQVRELLAGGGLRVGRPGDPAASEDHDLVRDLDHLVELVGDEDDGRARGGERADDPEQLLGLARGQHRTRLVEDEDVALSVQRLEDLDALSDADRQVLDLGVGIHIELVLLRELDDALARRRPIERAERPADGLRAQRHGLDHVEHGHEHEVLVDHANADARWRRAGR